MSKVSSSEKTTKWDLIKYSKEISFGTILIRKVLQTVEAKRKNKFTQLAADSPEEF